MEKRVKLFPEHFKRGRYSGTLRDFDWYETLVTKPRGGEDLLEYWYADDPDESEYLDGGFQKHIDGLLEKLKEQGWDPEKQPAYCISQSHLDLGWMWRFRQGVAKAEKTFGKVHGHFKLFKPFTFTGSQPAQYQWVKMHSPGLWEKIVGDVAGGRHEPQGGSWCEADGRMPSGEAWVRQRLYGQLFYARTFGKIADVAWFPDSFGYANNLPQIFSKSGATGFFTAKLISNKETKWPFWSWWWFGPDGSRLLSYMCGSHNKLGPLGAYSRKQVDCDVDESYVGSNRLVRDGKVVVFTYDDDEPENHPDISDEEVPLLGVFFGEGDGGHGPQGVEMATCRGMVERGVARWSSTGEFYNLLKATSGNRLPSWDDELYYEFHRGSLTTQTLVKRMNRYFEWHLPVAEAMEAILSTVEPGIALDSFKNFYPEEDDQDPTTGDAIEQIWQNVLLMQFHDVLPGTSIPEVYDECFEFWSQDKPLLEKIVGDAMDALGRHHGLDDAGVFRFILPAGGVRLGVGDSDDGGGGGGGEVQITELLVKPVQLANLCGARGIKIIEFPESEVKGLLPFGLAWKSPSGDIETAPVQHIDADMLEVDLDARKARYIGLLPMDEWTTGSCWLVAIDERQVFRSAGSGNRNELLAGLFREFLEGNANERSDVSIARNGANIVLSSGELKFSVGAEDGGLASLSLGGREYLDGVAGLKAYVDKPYREPCWNFMNGWWKEELDSFSSARSVSLLEEGPVRWTLRVEQEFCTGSTAIIDYSLVRGLEGVLVSLFLDFHETETLVKYKIPAVIGATHSIAETCYATSRRRNRPVANHDIPRWEKWMHTFVTLENDAGSGRGGLAVINDGKYGFDTIDGVLGVSIVHGPRYPGTNVVAWAREERKRRLESGGGEPPTHADQGKHVTRLWLVPYAGTWKDGQLHHLAHGFNAPARAKVMGLGGRRTGRVKERFIHAPSGLIENLQQESARVGTCKRWIVVNKDNVEITVLKLAENLPACFEHDRGGAFSGTTGALIVRVVNNIDENNVCEFTLHPDLVEKFRTVVEVDLLERGISCSSKPHVHVRGEARGEITVKLELKPHELRTFKIL
ncbi:MAG: glycoside hydrolase family 38 C-terminal domain-containing protein [Promethearchaeota archaeon]